MRMLFSHVKKKGCLLIGCCCLIFGLAVYFSSRRSHVLTGTPVINWRQGPIEEAARKTVPSTPTRTWPSPTLPCSQHTKHTNYSVCPTCFRPAVVSVSNRLQEIGYKDSLIPDKDPGYFTPTPEVVEWIVTDYLLVPEFQCPYLLVIQPSVVHRRDERDIVRQTWGSVSRSQEWPYRKINAEVKLLFILARQNPEKGSGDDHHQNTTLTNPHPLDEVQSEADRHKDILFLDMIDSYRNLTLKILSAFKWVKDTCPCVKFVLKVDFDTFVNIPLLVDTLLYCENRWEVAVLGMVYASRNRVKRLGRWAVSEALYPMAKFPEYASGCGYVLSIKALSKIVETVPHFKIIPIEDSFITGILRRVTGFKLISFRTLFTHYLDKKWHHCQMFEDSKILGLTVTPQAHHVIWNSFVNNSCPRG